MNSADYASLNSQIQGHIMAKNNSIFEDSYIKLSSERWVSDAIGDDYLYKWSANTPVFISAQTGSGKNTFIENKIIESVISRNEKILILSNRIALSRQTKNRIADIIDRCNKQNNDFDQRTSYKSKFKNYTSCGLDDLEYFDKITIKSYQKFLSNHCDDNNSYAFIIIDECHFFIADSKFNKYTDHIL